MSEPHGIDEVAETEHGSFVLTVKEYAPNDRVYRVFIAAEPIKDSKVPRFAIWLKEGTSFEDARDLADHLNRLRDTVSVTTFLRVQGGAKPS